MSRQHRVDGIQADIDPDKVTLHMVGVLSMTIERPKGVGVLEWEEFWGGDEPSMHPAYESPPSKKKKR